MTGAQPDRQPSGGAAVSPAPVWDVINGFAGYWATCAAVELGLFEQLASGPLETAALADATGVADPGDLALLAELLTALGLLDSDGVRWALTEPARRFLVAAAPMSMTELVRLSPGPPRGWPALAATVRAGAPDEQTTAALGRLYPELVRATAATQRAVAEGVAAELTGRAWWPEAGRTVVDLGCGSGAWLIALTSAGGGSGIGVDLPPVIDAFEPAPAGRSITLIAGDYLDVALPVERADVVVLAHVLRAEPAERAAALVTRALDLAGPDGVLLVADYFRPPSGQPGAVYAGARHELTLALTMRASTAGRGLTEADLAAWCAARGARTVDVLEPVPRQRVHLITRRPEGAR